MKLPWQPCTAGVTLALTYMVMNLLLYMHQSSLIDSNSVAFIFYEYSVHALFICNWMFVAEKERNTGYIHILLSWTQIKYSCLYIGEQNSCIHYKHTVQTEQCRIA